MKYIVLNLLVLLSVAFSCQQESQQRQVPVLNKLETKDAPTKGVEYVAEFESKEAANEHIAAVEEQGGEAKTIGSSETFVKVKVSADQAGQLTVPEQSKVVKDAAIKVIPKNNLDDKIDPALLADNVMTAKGVVGVDALRARFPEADGRGVKVAVFDTGIDFDLAGVSDGEGDARKLLGFYDMTNFGRVKIADNQKVNVEASELMIGGSSLKLAKSLEVKRLSDTNSLP